MLSGVCLIMVTNHPLRDAIQGVLVERTTVACFYAVSPHGEVVRCHGNMSRTNYLKFVMISQDMFQLNICMTGAAEPVWPDQLSLHQCRYFFGDFDNCHECTQAGTFFLAVILPYHFLCWTTLVGAVPWRI